MDLVGQIRQYVPWNAQEEQDRAELLHQLQKDTVCLRENRAAHMTASAWVVNADRDRVLMAYHNIYS